MYVYASWEEWTWLRNFFHEPGLWGTSLEAVSLLIIDIAHPIPLWVVLPLSKDNPVDSVLWGPC